MKLKLKQKVAIGFYKTKIKTIALVNKRKAAEATFNLFCKPYSGKPNREKPIIFKHAEKLSFQYQDLTIRGWRWIPESANNKTILIAHGFDSCSYKFEKYIQSLTKNGFTVLAFDAPAHGISDGKQVNAIIYRNVILKITELFGDLYGIVAHSLGGLAASFAAEELPHLQKLVLLAPATETNTAINNFFKFVQLGDTIKEELIKVIEEKEGKPYSYYSVNRAIKQIKAQTLWIHDENDWVCPLEDAKPTRDLQLNHVQFFITKGLGHNKVYKIDSTIKQVINFIQL